MTITAKISSAEVLKQVTDRYINQFFEVALINAPGVNYSPGTTDDALFLTNEVTFGVGGYDRQVIGYTSADLTSYSDFGVGLAQKASVFTHDGGGTTIDFTHVALLNGVGNVVVLGTPSLEPIASNDGVYTGVPTTTDGAGVGLTLRFEVTTNIITVEIESSGRNYAAGDSVVVDSLVLEQLGIIPPGGNSYINTVQSATEIVADSIVSVAQTSSAVSLSGGNQAVFYWNIKEFGYFSQG